jgi:hypothetical protein
MKRPTVVSVVAAFLLVATVMGAVLGTSLLFPGTFLDRLWELNKPAYAAFQVLGKASGVLLVVVGAATAAAAAGLLQGSRWGWQLAIAIFAMNGLGDAVSLFLTRDLFKSGSGVLIAALFLTGLFRRNVKVFFQKSVGRSIS